MIRPKIILLRFLMRDFLKLSPCSGALMEKLPWGSRGQCPRENFLAYFVAYCESYVQDKKTVVFGDYDFVCCFLKKKLYCHILHFSLWIVKFLQLCGRRKIAKPYKYYLAWLFFFDTYFFFSIMASHRFGNFKCIPFTKNLTYSMNWTPRYL